MAAYKMVLPAQLLEGDLIRLGLDSPYVLTVERVVSAVARGYQIIQVKERTRVTPNGQYSLRSTSEVVLVEPIKPVVGMRFRHSRLLAPNNVCWVTKVAEGQVYYKLDGERKAKNYFPIADVYNYIREVL